MWKRTTGTNNCPYLIPFEAVYNTEEHRILTHAQAQKNTGGTPHSTTNTPATAEPLTTGTATTTASTTTEPATLTPTPAAPTPQETPKENPTMNHTIGESAAKGKNTTPVTFTHNILTHTTANDPSNLTLGALAGVLGVTAESLVAVFSD